MRDWLAREPIVIAGGQGAVLRDVRGREYLDANSSIWTNLHGHNHPRINSAIQRQLKKIAHRSALGLANEPARLLAGKLVEAANHLRDSENQIGAQSESKSKLEKVFFSDDGSTALEVALKLAYEFTRRTRGNRSNAERPPAQVSFRSKARITATPLARFRSATLICFTRPMPACSSRPTRSCRRIATAARSTAPSRSAPTRGNTGNATGNASARWNRNFPRKRKREILMPPLSSNRRCRARRE